MKNKLVFPLILIPILLISGCKRNSKTSGESSLYSSSSNQSYFISSTSPSSTSEETKSYSTIDILDDGSGIFETHIQEGCGTKVSENSRTVKTDGYLTDASVNHITGNVYTPSVDGTSIEKETSILSNDFDNEMIRGTVNNKNIYSVMTFYLTFKVKIGPGSSDLALFFEPGGSFFDVDGNPGSEKAYRIGFISDNIYRDNSTGVSRVYAGLQTANNCSYVANINDFDGTSYTNDLVDCENHQFYTAGYEWDIKNREELMSKPGYLGYFPHHNQDAVVIYYLSYAVMIWLEGTDPELVNRSSVDFLKPFTASLFFATTPLLE